MSISSAFLWRFLDDVWDILPTEDRQLFETFWLAQIQIAANIQQKVIEAALSTEVEKVPVFLTERWNRFIMNEDSCDLFSQTDSLTLHLTVAAALSRETAFYDTLKVSTSSGQIPHQETMLFFDSSVRQLRYGKIVKGTISVTIGTKEYTPGRDYVVNLETGAIQAVDEGRIPIDQLATIRYQHKEYVRDLDYVVDEVASTIARTASSAIADADTVSVTYTYNGTATIPLEGAKGRVTGATLIDDETDFSAVVAGRTLTIASGPNVGTYTINAIIGPNEITIDALFPQDQDADVVYSINAFPHGVKVDKAIVSIPHLRDLVSDPTLTLVENVDFVVRDGILASRCAFPLAVLGPADLRDRQMWAETTKIDRQTPYRNFGVLIDFFRKNSEEYKLALQGLWYTFWTGSTPGNLQRGLHILLGLPFAKRAGTVTRVDVAAAEIDVTDPRGQIITYTIPTGLDPVVERGDAVKRFASLTTGVNIIDRNNEPGFVTNRLGRAGIQRFLTSKATKGLGDTDETKALKLLEHHLFLPQILVEAITRRINVQELVTFLENMKPKWTEYVFSFQSEESEPIILTEDLPGIDIALDMTLTVNSNEQAESFAFSNFFLTKSSGEIIGSGSQALGNFRDNTEDFAADGIDEGDFVWIPSGPFYGMRSVLKRVSTHVLSLDIPDEDLQIVLNLNYSVITEEQSDLGHDSIGLGHEHIVRNGTAYGFGIATLVPFATTSSSRTSTANLNDLSEQEILALLLVDIGLPGNEVQRVLTVDMRPGYQHSFTVPVLPANVPRDHQFASAALVRTDNSGPTVTDVYAI